MWYTSCNYDDCGVPIAIDLEAAQKPGAYGYECPICKRGLRFGVVQRLMHVVLSGEAKGPGLDQDGTSSF